ncbi:hypothetical protein BV898_17054 [Hypsibius exemplaris]|uniref:G-protein coupled receptors family 1 profile domain-containing protein n=1 Tax=Hypsibius exemplaris TaxID=2072580 RepID=A0A9X6NHA0_HYPEX|nr:hypothetical protein BV898_17054 [Hypsibius exemplaris]
MLNLSVSSFNWTSNEGNCTSQADAWNLVHRSALTVWFATFLAFSLLGILTNDVQFIVIIRSQTLRSGAGALILHVIANCFITSAIHNPVYGILIYGDNFWFARPRDICRYVYFLMSMTQFATNWAEASLAVNRLIAVGFPFAYKAWSTRKVTGMMIAASWLMAGASFLSNTFERSGRFYARERNTRLCTEGD